MWGWIKSEFAFGNVVSQLVWTVILAGLGRGATWLFGIQPKSELAYWAIVPAMLLVLALTVRKLSGRVRLPDLNCHIEHMAFGAAEFIQAGTQGRGALLIVMASIRNRGVPTVTSSFDLSLALPAGQLFTGMRMSIHEDVMKVANSAGITQVLHREDGLDRKTVTPIPQGGIAQGFLMFVFPGIEHKLLQDPAAVVTLTFRDAWGRENKLKRPIGPLSASGPMPSLPGITIKSLSIEKELPAMELPKKLPGEVQH